MQAAQVCGETWGSPMVSSGRLWVDIINKKNNEEGKVNDQNNLICLYSLICLIFQELTNGKEHCCCQTYDFLKLLFFIKKIIAKTGEKAHFPPGIKWSPEPIDVKYANAGPS